MRPGGRFALLLVVLTLLAVALLGLWSAGLWVQLPPGERALLRGLLAPRVGWLALLPFLVLGAVALVLRGFWRGYLLPLRRLSAQARLMLRVNPGHRASPSGAPELRELAASIDALAAGNAVALAEVEAQVRAARADLASERDRLATLVAELTEAVVVCNGAGEILLYNQRARLLLERGGGGPVGLGRSLFSLLESEPVLHALETLRHRRAEGHGNQLSRFLTHTRGGPLVRVHLAPVGEATGAGGFVLTLDDVSRRVASELRRAELLRSFTERMRGSLASLRAAVETLDAFPLEREQRRRLREVVREEMLALSARLEGAGAELAEHSRAEWPLENMLAGELVAGLLRRMGAEAGVRARPGPVAEGMWVRVDAYSLERALLRIATLLRERRGVEETTVALVHAGAFARLDLEWTGAPLPLETLRAWEVEPADGEAGLQPATLREVVERHGGEIWTHAELESYSAALRVFLPLAHPEEPWLPQPPAGSRPEFYDFDLFSRAALHPELEHRPLRRLAYTVFDTETTGLEPSRGDEIVSVGAVRIVNARLLRQEVFDALVNPRRALTPESVAVHGIRPEQLRGAPPAEEVLPRFHRFAEDTVLVAHNAAFDLRFLELKEESAGVRFDQPVLDTLLLSVLLHPEEPDHTLEGIAARLGLEVVGRHTALGDALLTGEVLLAFLPLLEERGITTLGEAREASRKSAFARVRY